MHFLKQRIFKSKTSIKFNIDTNDGLIAIEWMKCSECACRCFADVGCLKGVRNKPELIVVL